MDLYGSTHAALNIDLHRGLYLAIIIFRYEGPHTSLTIGLHGGLYLAFIYYLDEGPHTSLLWLRIEDST
jgi:hypothetical protein